VSICLQEIPHWIFLFHNTLLSRSANLRVTITFVRSQPCFNVVRKGGETPFPPHYTTEKVGQLDQGFSTGAHAPHGGHGAVLRGPRAEAFTKELCRDIAKPC